MVDLLTLPGVARKTANVVLGTWFGKAEGLVVDTHVYRISRGWSSRKMTIQEYRADLMRAIPRGNGFYLPIRSFAWASAVLGTLTEMWGCPLENIVTRR